MQEMIRRGVFDQSPNALIRRIDINVKEIKVGTMVNTIERDTMFDMEIKTVITTSIRVTIVIEIIEVGPMFHLKIGKLLLKMVEVAKFELRICYIK